MKKVISSEKFPIKLWLDDLEPIALRQAKNLANLPFVHKWIAIMPDAHQGYGMPIGGVLAARDVVVPNAVGVDIGCGMCSMKTSLRIIEKEVLKKVMGRIRAAVPVGFDHHQEKQLWSGFDRAPDVKIIETELHNAHFQLGTLGGGNHFIEIQLGSDGFVWAMVHSGSRNFGLKIAREFHGSAKRLCERWQSDIPDQDLAFLPMETKEAENYFDAMNFACTFADENRLRIMGAIRQAMLEEFPGTAFEKPLSIHHNYASRENHFNKNVIVHRKGATAACSGQQGLIPGSQGTKSYVVRGLGNADSFMSCSHGAGRRLGRKQAQRELDLTVEKKRLNDLGIVHALRNKGDLDEAAGAYKDIGEVMENQRDLVSIEVELSPLGVIKA